MAKTPDKDGPVAPVSDVHGAGYVETPLPEEALSEPMGRDDDELVDTTEFARHMRLPPQRIRNHLSQNRVIGWRIGSQKFLLPLNQLGPNNQYIPNLPRLLQIIPEPAIAWLWSTQPNVSTAGERPLDRLHAGYTDEVLYAAGLYDEGAFT